MDLVNTQLVATQQQLAHLQQRYDEMSMHHAMLVQEVIGLQKTVVNHEHVMQNVMNFLHSVDARQRRDSKMAPPGASRDDGGAPSGPMDPAQRSLSPLADEPASPLQNASKLLSGLNADVQLNYKNLEYMSDMHHRANGSMSTPPPDSGSRSGHPRAPASAGSSTSMAYAKLHTEPDAVVYPVGQNNGIDPMYSEHIHNIPYPMPTEDPKIVDPRKPVADGRKKSSQIDPGWIRPPQILLVEDDPTCRRIGSRFLYSVHCSIDSAVSGPAVVARGRALTRASLTVSRP